MLSSPGMLYKNSSLSRSFCYIVLPEKKIYNCFHLQVVCSNMFKRKFRIVSADYSKCQNIPPQCVEDSSGTIDKSELATIMFKISSSMSEREIDKLLAVIDKNQDGLIDYKEFVGWLTDREADRTVGKDGWIEAFDIQALMRPMFNVFDRNKDGLIKRSELQECSQILGNSLSIHPASTSDCLVLDWKELPNKEEVNFQDFVDWQVKHLQKSGIPNNQLPTLMEELCESMQIIFDIDQLNQKGVENSKVHEALADSVKKVADATRRIYTKKLSQLDLNN